MPIQLGAKGANINGVDYPPRQYIDWLTPAQEATAVQGGDAIYVPANKLTYEQFLALNLGRILASDGSVWALSEALPTPVRLTASGLIAGSVGEHRGFECIAISGGPQTIVVYDNTAGSGTVAKTYTINAIGHYYFDGDGITPGNGKGARRPMAIGAFATISGGASRTIDFF